ncbi:alpha/beta hydrolase [Nocardia amamiensis]|uniref:alpha/beta hydrolase n=1 Tax=Nocardia amamiensis TaxID=404578 RepID=UPI0034100160
MQRVEVISIDGTRLEAAVHSASAPPRGAVLLAHGITVDMDEGGGMFVRLAEQLTAAGFDVVRFSFRGHGNSGGTQQGVTISGECLDLQAAMELVRAQFAGPVSIVAASFGAVPTMLSLPWVADGLHRLVLWNPVLDLRHTFLEPDLAWGIQNFGPGQRQRLVDDGFLVVDGQFELGRVLFCELAHYKPLDEFFASWIPTLIVHGDQDTAVAYRISADTAAARPDTTLHTISGSDHGFDSQEREDKAIAATVDWLIEQSTAGP